LEISGKIKSIKALSPRNRFVFVFEDLRNLKAKHRRSLEDDGMPCLSLNEFRKKPSQINVVLSAMKLAVEIGSTDPREQIQWERLMQQLENLSTSKALEGANECFATKLVGIVLSRLEEPALNNSDHVTTRNAKAAAFKALGRLSEALDVYEATVQEFPQDIVARNGMAGTLRGLGKLTEALEVYEVTIREFPLDVTARTGKGETLMAMGRFTEALDAHLEVPHVQANQNSPSGASQRDTRR